MSSAYLDASLLIGKSMAGLTEAAKTLSDLLPSTPIDQRGVLHKQI